MKSDLPGQLRLDGGYAAKPDDACRLCARPLQPPLRKRGARLKARRRCFNLRLDLRDKNGDPVWLPSDYKFIEIQEREPDGPEHHADNAGDHLPHDGGIGDTLGDEQPPF